MPQPRGCVTLVAMKQENSMNVRPPMSVLLVEDAAPVRQRLCSLIAENPSLRLIGQAATVAEASSLLDAMEPTAVVLDLGLPDGTGIDVLRHVRETNSKCVVIILSNYLDPETYNRCSELGADFLFSKSDEFEQAIETLRALANGTERGMQDRPEAERVHRAKLAVTSPIGIHARPAAMLVKLAQSFDADIEISLNGHSTSAKSILGLLTLCAGCGAEAKVAAVGADAEEAIGSITALFACGFHEAQTVVAHGARTTSEAAAPLRDKGATILIADDDDGIREMVKRILEGSGYQTVTARNGVEAVALLTANRGTIKAAVLDMIMPEMSGLEAMSAIRRMSPNLPLLAMSGSLERPLVSHDAATAFLKKPFGRAELVPVLRTLLDRAALGQPLSVGGERKVEVGQSQYRRVER